MSTPVERVAELIRQSLRSAEVHDLIEPADPAPPHPEWDFEERFYTPLQVVRPARPFAPEEPGVPTFRDVVLDGIRDVRQLLVRCRLGPGDCKAYLTDPDEVVALVYARINGIVLAVVATCEDEPADTPAATWELTVAVNVDDEAIR